MTKQGSRHGKDGNRTPANGSDSQSEPTTRQKLVTRALVGTGAAYVAMLVLDSFVAPNLVQASMGSLACPPAISSEPTPSIATDGCTCTT